MPNSSPPSRANVSVSRIPPAKRRGDGFEQIVAGAVAEPIVHVLEVIQIDQHHRAATTVSRRGHGFFAQRLLKAAAVEQGRQKIMVDEVLHAPFELFARGDVLNLRDEMRRFVVLSNQRHAQEHPHRMAPRVTIPFLNRVRRAPTRQEVLML